MMGFLKIANLYINIVVGFVIFSLTNMVGYVIILPNDTIIQSIKLRFN